MEADWSVEIGGGAPVIDAAWEGLVDIRNFPERVNTLQEIAGLPSLKEGLLYLNAPGSRVWTSKCDFWEMDGEELDPRELGAEARFCHAGLACYIDVLSRQELDMATFERVEQWARGAVKELQEIPSPNCRIDLVVREAVTQETSGFGLTVYVIGCGAIPSQAKESLGKALEISIPALCVGISA